MAFTELRLENEPSSSAGHSRPQVRTVEILRGFRWPAWLFGVLLYILFFALLFHLGSFFGKGYEGSLWYPGAGLRLAVLLVFGWRAIPVLIPAELLAIYGNELVGVNYYDGLTALLPVSLTTLLYGLAVSRIRRHLDARLGSPQDVAALLITALFLPLAISSLTRLATVALGNLEPEHMVPSMLSFWIGDAIGILMLTPVLLRLRARMSIFRAVENPGILVGAPWLLMDFVVCWVVVAIIGSLPLEVVALVGEVHWYLAFLPVVWFAFKHHLEGAAVSSLAVCSAAAWWFDVSPTSLRFHELQLLIGLFSATGLMFGAVLAARRASEMRLQRRNLQLVAVRGELEQRNRELALRSTEMGRFVNAASHELKTPLVTIAGFLGRLRRRSKEIGWQGIDGDLDRIQAATRTMDGLLEGLLEYSKAASWPADRVVISLEAVLRSVVSRLEATGLVAAEGLGQILRVADELPRIVGQRHWIEELLQHLIENGIRFTRDCAEPQIEVGWRRQGAETVIEVRDNGIGIDPRYHERVFDLFERLDPDQGGRGLGLALARRIAEAQGGRIWVESEGEGQGTTVCFTVEVA